ncbi:MAG: hypothetical protein H7835_06450 [Magnetococcus sp. XQGC-1]
MSEIFSLIPEWAPTEYGSEEIRQTSGSLRINVRNRSVIRVDDDWAKSVRDTVRVSSYPLALWFASNWWRLCWEPTPETKPSTDWCLSHEMHGSGHGFLWPPVRFASDGEAVSIICTPSAAESSEPIRYLTTPQDSIPLNIFMETVAAFIQTVLARLETCGIRNTELHTLWQEVTRERADPESRYHRQLEAQLGFDPDDAPERVVNALLNLAKSAGKSSVAEIAAACAGRDPDSLLHSIEQSTRCPGIQGNLSAIPKVTLGHPPAIPERPWERGYTLAQAVRAELGIHMEPLEDKHLCDLFAVPAGTLMEGEAPMKGIPWSLAIRNAENSQVSLLFRRNHRHGRRFEMARWLADIQSTSLHDRWLPATDVKKMARQKMQRAFAAELLAPIAALRSFLTEDLTDEDRILDAGNHFGVSPQVVEKQLVNHGLLSPETERME